MSVPVNAFRYPRGIIIHRRSLSPEDVRLRDAIPVTSPICTLVDLATFLDEEQLVRAINEADHRDLVKVPELRAALDRLQRRRGLPMLRDLLDQPTFTLTDSELERLFLPIARGAGLTRPVTGAYVNGWKVDFYWPELGLVVETDGLRYHRTPFQQERDRERDQTHVAAGLTPLRFTHRQIARRPAYVEEKLITVARNLTSRRPGAFRTRTPSKERS